MCPLYGDPKIQLPKIMSITFSLAIDMGDSSSARPHGAEVAIWWNLGGKIMAKGWNKNFSALRFTEKGWKDGGKNTEDVRQGLSPHPVRPAKWHFAL